MFLPEGFRMAGVNLWNHKLRSLLTILGVVIGVGSVIAVVTLGQSFENSITSQFDAIDDRTVYVYSTVTPLNAGPPDCMQYCNIFTQVDLDAVRDIDGVERVIEYAEVPSTSLAVGGQELTFDGLTATVPEADEVRKAEEYASGGPFASGANEVVLGFQVARFLSPNAPIEAGAAIVVRLPDGQAIEATVAGVLLEDTTFFGDRNGRVFVPVDPFHNMTRTSPSTGGQVRVYSSLTIVAADIGAVVDVRDDARAYIVDESDADELKVEGQVIDVSRPSDIQAGIAATFSQVTIFIGAIGGISLVVGAIGIANIMLVSVTERTREIGVMKAIGARNREILTLFLLESIIIGFIGSLLGIGLGLAGGAAIVNGVFGDEGVSIVWPYEWIGISIVIGIGVGVVAGFLPAQRATRIQPIQALAYE